jgi:hypothetical protein
MTGPGALILEPLGLGMLAASVLGGAATGVMQSINEKRGTSRAVSLGTEMLAGGLAEGMVSSAKTIAKGVALGLKSPVAGIKEVIADKAEQRLKDATTLRNKTLQQQYKVTPTNGFDEKLQSRVARTARGQKS